MQDARALRKTAGFFVALLIYTRRQVFYLAGNIIFFMHRFDLMQNQPKFLIRDNRKSQI